MQNDALTPFHIAFPVHDLVVAEEFYAEVLGCPTGRRSEGWIDFDLFGHQIVTHLVPGMDTADKHYNKVDGHNVPVPHFGVVLDLPRWRAFADRLRSQDVKFVLEPLLRFEGQPGEQATMFFLDPSGNALEFKAFNDLNSLFAV